MLLKVLTIVLGSVVVVMRGIGFVSPSAARKMMAGFIDRKLWLYVTGLVLAIFGATLFYAARCAVWIDETQTIGKGIWGLILGAWVAIGGLMILIVPGAAIGMLKRFLAWSDSVVRILTLIGVLVGLAILWLGIWVY